MVLVGAKRTTSNVDILVSEEDLTSLYLTLSKVEHFVSVDGQVFCSQEGKLVRLGVLTAAVNTVTFEGVLPHTITLEGCVRAPRLDYSLAMKVKCFYLRPDNEDGRDKVQSDLEDVKYLARQMAAQSLVITDECARDFQFSIYHMLMLRMELGSPETIRLLLKIGVRKLLLSWELNSDNSKEYYQAYVVSPKDPFEDEIFVEEDEEDEEGIEE